MLERKRQSYVKKFMRGSFVEREMNDVIMVHIRFYDKMFIHFQLFSRGHIKGAYYFNGVYTIIF